MEALSPSCSHASTSTRTSKPVLDICATCYRGKERGLSLCSRCRCARFCSKECQRKAWKVHKPICTTLCQKLISCVRMVAPGSWSTHFLTAADPRFEEAFPSPVMHRIGIPVCILPLQSGVNNQWATYFMIDPISGLAPYPFMDLGPVLILRRDRVPISEMQVALLGDFFTSLVGEFGGDDDNSIHKRLMTRAYFLQSLKGLSDRNNCSGLAW